MSDTNEDTSPTTSESTIKVGISVNASSPELQVPKEALSAAQDEEFEEILGEVASWWDSLSVAERVDTLQLDNTDGREITENIIYIDEVDPETQDTTVLWE